jgi:hypothetical protein
MEELVIKRITFALASLAVAASAQAAGDQFIFGSSGPNIGNYLSLNGSTDLSFVDQGWYRNTGYHSSSNKNYIVGYCANCGGYDYRNWFIVDLTGFSGPVTSASMRLYSYDVTLTSGNYYLNDFTGSVSSLRGDSLEGSAAGLATFADLGTGVNYGYRFYQSATDSNQFHTIALNSGAVASLNTAIANHETLWALGGAFAPGGVPIPPPIPEPATYAFMLLGLGLLGAVARRRG